MAADAAAGATQDWLLLRCRRAIAANAIRGSLQPGQRTGTLVVLLGGALLSAVWGRTLLVMLAHAMWLRAHPMALALGLLTAAAIIGNQSGSRVGARMAATSQLPFLCVQPWGDTARQRACRLGQLPDAALQSVAAAAIVFLALRTTHTQGAAVEALAAALLFGASFLLAPIPPTGPVPTLRPDRARPPVGRRTQALLQRLDRSPRWLATWALDGNTRSIASSAIALLLTLGLLGAAASIATRTIFPGLLVAILGGHAVFVLALRAHPLAAQALRVQPIRFGPAVWAIARLPLLASLAWFLIPAVTTLAAGLPAIAAITASAVWLLLLDGIFLILSAAMPKSPRTAAAIHLLALAIAAQNLAMFSPFLELPLLAAFLLVFWRRGRNSFAHG